MEIIQDKVKRLPKDAGVYIMKDKDGNIIYVGKAKNLKKRVSQYFLRKQEHVKVRKMVENIVDFDFFVVNDEIEALALENPKDFPPGHAQVSITVSPGALSRASVQI